MVFFLFKQNTAYDMRISDWSSDVCSSDLKQLGLAQQASASAAQMAVSAVSGGASQMVKALEAQKKRFLAAGDKRFEERRVGKECGDSEEHCGRRIINKNRHTQLETIMIHNHT